MSIYMTNQELLKSYYEITTGKFGNISKRHNQSYFYKNSHNSVWDEVVSRTSFLSEDASIVHRLHAISIDLTSLALCKTCKINPSRIIGTSKDCVKYTEYCCSMCQLKSKEHSVNVSKGKKLQNHVVANKKREHTMIAKFGHAFNTQRPEIKEKMTNSSLIRTNHPAIKYLTDKEWMFNEYVTNMRPSTHISKELGITYYTVIEYLRGHDIEIRHRYNKSIGENEVSNFIKSLGFNVINNDRTLLSPYEIDIVVSEKRLGIEYSGLYWHSVDSTVSKIEKEKHLRKTNSMIAAGYDLLHINEFEWENKKEIVKSIISNKLGLNEKIFARKCKLSFVEKAEERAFLESNHIQGYVSSKICIGLYYDERLVQLMSFGTPRFDKAFKWELLRSCSILNLSVIGGASKLFKSFLGANNGSVICYADRRYGEGLTYQKIGMSFSHNTSVGYCYTDKHVLLSRYKCQKHKLSKFLKHFDEKLSETENMFANNYRQMFDCGNAAFTLVRDK